MTLIHVQPRRRGTVLLMVVSLLALLFVVVSGFLAVSRFDEQVTQEVKDGDTRQSLLDTAEQAAAALIADSLRDPANGKIMGGPGASMATIPGYRGTSWLSSLEFIWNEGLIADPPVGDFAHLDGSSINLASAWGQLARLSLAAVSALETPADGLPVTRSILDLMPEFAWDNNETFARDDIIDAVRQGWMDADGDGVPDTDILHQGLLGETLNAVNGTPARLPDPEAIYGGPVSPRWLHMLRDPDDTLSEVSPRVAFERAWRRYLEERGIDVAQRIVSHGGMVTLSAPTVAMGPALGYPGDRAEPPFRQFQVHLFEAVSNGTDTQTLAGWYDPDPFNYDDVDRLFDELAAYAPAVEAALRNRFFLPPPMYADESVDVPPVLAALQGDVQPPQWMRNLQFPTTFIPTLSTGGFGHTSSSRYERGDRPIDVRQRLHQRINLADIRGGNGDLHAFPDAATVRPVLYNLPAAAAAPAALRPEATYDRRHLITAHNYSDELMLKQDPREPDPAAPIPGLRTWRGEQKFYLGEINKAFVEYGTDGGQWYYDRQRGGVIVERLARIFHDMLSSHGGWGGVGSGTGSSEPVDRTTQAYMLAVNTVAFASPRDSRLDPTGLDEMSQVTGWIDPVVHTTVIGSAPVTYIGYAPQPFITEAIAYRDSEDQDVSIGIELFNPQDPYLHPADPTIDVFALNLRQFRIAIHDLDSDTTWTSGPLEAAPGPTQRMNGREFLAFAVSEGSNSYFNNVPTIRVLPSSGLVLSNTGTKIEIRLQRRAKDPTDLLTLNSWDEWYTVDEMRLDLPVGEPDEDDRWTSAFRDTAPYEAFGTNAGGPIPLPPARWGVVVPGDASRSRQGNGTPGTGSLGFPAAEGVSAATPTFAPDTPLITMNARPGTDVAVFGPHDLRPNSFPTVGFMLFVPRFAHTWRPLHDERKPVGRWLREYLNEGLGGGGPQHGGEGGQGAPAPEGIPSGGGGGGSAIGGPPDVGLGHMPVFYNGQSILSQIDLTGTSVPTYLSRVGAVPWGQLVFEYFTTLNPDAPGVDPLRVPGRIDINAAPWYVLAKLPMIGPYDPTDVVAPAPNPDGRGRLPIRPWLKGHNPDLIGDDVTAADPSPSFWDPQVGVLAGKFVRPSDPGGRGRLLVTDRAMAEAGMVPGSLSIPLRSLPQPSPGRPGVYELGPWLAQAAAAYRDGVQYLNGLPDPDSNPAYMYADAHLRGIAGAGQYAVGTGLAVSAGSYRPTGFAGNGYPSGIRGQDVIGFTPPVRRPTEAGFVTVGELLNVKGWDSSLPFELPVPTAPSAALTRLGRNDFIGAVSLLALLDAQYLTTRSNTFTIYTSIMDRTDGNENQSVRGQLTIDRSNLLPRVQYGYYRPLGWTPPSGAGPFPPPGGFAEAAQLNNPSVRALLPRVPVVVDANNDGVRETVVRTENDNARPQVISSRRGAYFSSMYDN